MFQRYASQTSRSSPGLTNHASQAFVPAADCLGGCDFVDQYWQQSTTFARRCYLAQQAPGTPLPGPASGLPAWAEGLQPSEDQVAPARPNFAVLWVGVTAIDWLHLANSGHRRARFSAADGWVGAWVAP